MSKLMRLVDFQVYARPAGLADGGQRTINEALFTSCHGCRFAQARLKLACGSANGM